MRILILLRSVPYPADNGGKLRASYLADYLAEHHEVSVACFANPSEQRPGPEVTDRFVDFRVVPVPPQPLAWRRWLGREPGDVLQLKTPDMARCVEQLIAKHDPHVILAGDPALTTYVAAHPDRVRVLDYICVITLQFERFRRLAAGPQRTLWAMRKRKFAAYHRRIADQYDVCILNSQEDQEDLVATAPGWSNRIEVIPNGLDLRKYPTGLAPTEPNTMVFPGSVTYPPNFDAVAHFAERILPAVRQAVPDARLVVTGRVPEDGSAPRSEGLSYTGYVEDVRVPISSAWVCVVPLRLGGGGARYKVLESMALGTPMVSTAIGAEGIAYTDGTDILMAEDPETFTARTIQILKSPELRRSISEAARELIERKYDWHKLLNRIDEMLLALVEKHRTVVA
jgi:glycosyltransferase involved in cell wall biosynthesis